MTRSPARVDRDGIELAAAMQDAEHAFGALKCDDAVKAARTAIGLAAQRQAAGLAVPELTHAWAYVLLCADKNGDANGATLAANRLRALGGSNDIDASLLARYPDIDAVSNREVVEIDVAPEVPGATIYVDFAPACRYAPRAARGRARDRGGLGRAARLRRRAGGARAEVGRDPDARSGRQQRRGRGAGRELEGPRAACRRADGGAGRVHARVALVRHEDIVEAWGHSGAADPLHRLGGDDGTRPLGEVDRLARSSPIAFRAGTITHPIPISRCWSRTCAYAPRRKSRRDRSRRNGGSTRRSVARSWRARS